MRRLPVLLVALCLVSVAACSGNSPAVPGAAPSAPTTVSTVATAADLTFCVTETNRYRTSIGRAALTQSAALEAYALEGARVDAQGTVPHQHFTGQSGGGIARAENELLRWPLRGSVQRTMTEGIGAFWSEGPAGGHYQNLTGPSTQIGCGVYIANGEITVVQDFR